MSEFNSIEPLNKYSNLSDQTKFRLNEINKIKDHFRFEIQEKKQWVKNYVKILLLLIILKRL